MSVARMIQNVGRLICIGILCGALSYAEQEQSAPLMSPIRLPYGDIVKVEERALDNAIIEHVTLYSQESESSQQHIRRRGTLVRYAKAKATVVICHGFMCDRFDSGFLRQLFPAHKFNVMTFDFRAHGECREGQVCTFGRNEIHDVSAAVNFVRNHPELLNKPVIAYGFSMGAASAIEAQARDSDLFDGMILDCPFDSTEKLLHGIIDKMHVSLFGYKFAFPGSQYMKKYIFHPYVQNVVKNLLKTFSLISPQDISVSIGLVQPAESIKKVTVPCMFIHCKNDERVTTAAVTSVYTNAQGPKSMWLTNGRRHCDSFFYNPELYKEKVAHFIDDVLGGSLMMSIDQGLIIDADEFDVHAVQDTAEGII